MQNRRKKRPRRPRKPSVNRRRVDKPTPEKAKPARKVKNDGEPVDHLPATLEELKASKSGLVSCLFLSGKDKEAIAAELKTAFELPESHALKIVRWITGREKIHTRVQNS